MIKRKRQNDDEAIFNQEHLFLVSKLASVYIIIKLKPHILSRDEAFSFHRIPWSTLEGKKEEPWRELLSDDGKTERMRATENSNFL